MMASRIAAMRLAIRGVRAGEWRAGGSGIMGVFREVGYGTGWSGGLPGPMSCRCSEHDTDS